MDLVVYFLEHLIDIYIDNKFSMDLRDYFLYLLKLLMDISKGILTIRPLGFQSLFPSLPSSF